MTRNQKLLWTAIIVAIALILGAFLVVQRGASSIENGKPRFNISLLRNPKPSLDRAVNFPAAFPEQARDVYLRNLATIKDKIRADETNVAAWNDLALYYKMVEDWDGSKQIWGFLVAAYPDEGVPLHNLAEHYFHVEKDYSKAETLYRQAIAAMVNFPSNYTDLYEMYRYGTKDFEKAAAVLKEGITAVGRSQKIDLLHMLGQFYRDIGNIEEARTYLTEARDRAEELGNSELAAQFDAEIRDFH